MKRNLPITFFSHLYNGTSINDFLYFLSIINYLFSLIHDCENNVSKSKILKIRLDIASFSLHIWFFFSFCSLQEKKFQSRRNCHILKKWTCVQQRPSVAWPHFSSAVLHSQPIADYFSKKMELTKHFCDLYNGDLSIKDQTLS